ncbi:hypothetical protein HBH53_079360 [Parastagonospora nodorum]|nr:hypothetical protein HBH53_079360 [Parastagonospora nodorum]KAH4968084.1 hypothetical protein HBI78_064270 [Parastagonospora nodorum]KAH5202017.1 hypothetical protein HBH77_121810 [Parastagonospora nodorum]KAH5724822.1 hypothetical protein HBI18_126660 [Parastagonospora nodorum]
MLRVTVINTIQVNGQLRGYARMHTHTTSLDQMKSSDYRTKPHVSVFLRRNDHFWKVANSCATANMGGWKVRIFNRIVSRVCDSGTESQKLVVSNRSRRDVEDIAKIAHLLECLGECKD